MSTSPDFQTILAQLGWTPERAAATLSVSPETISRWLGSPEHIPKRTLTVLKKYCQIYHVDAFDSPSDPADATDWAAKEGSSTKIEFGALDLRIRDLEEQLRHLRLRHRALIQENAELRQALKEGTPPPPREHPASLLRDPGDLAICLVGRSQTELLPPLKAPPS